MKLYLATSPRNLYLQVVMDGIKAAAHEVVLPDSVEWQMWGGDGKIRTDHTVALASQTLGRTDIGFDRRFEQMAECNAVVLMLPAPPSSFLEAGWFLGRQRPGVIYAPDGHITPELGFKLFERNPITQALEDRPHTPVVVDTVEGVLRELSVYWDRANRISNALRRCGMEDA